MSVCFDDLRVALLPFMHDVVLLVPLTVTMGYLIVMLSDFETIIRSTQNSSIYYSYSLNPVEGENLPQVEEFSYLSVLITEKGS